MEVEGDTFDAGTLIATKVEIEDDGISGADDGDDGEVEGYVTAFSSATNFSGLGSAGHDQRPDDLRGRRGR